MAEHVTSTTAKQEALQGANNATANAVHLSRRVMTRAGIDESASQYREVPLLGSSPFSESAGRMVSRVLRSLPIPREGTSEMPGARLVESRDEYYIKRPFVPSFLGNMAYTHTAFSVFSIETIIDAPGEGGPTWTAVPAEEPLRLHAGEASMAATVENIERGRQTAHDFMVHLSEALQGSTI